MAHITKEVDISRIYLQNDNPRHERIENESEIISHLITNESVKGLARHIAEAGATSPLERIAVIAHPTVRDAYVAVEGNRRICAMKLLKDPDKAGTEAHKKYFRSLSAKMERPPSKLEVAVFKDMETARPWISLRHEGLQDGAGTKSWNPEQKARFNTQGNSKNPNIQASLLVDYARRQRLLSPEKIDALPVTTLTRYLSNPQFREMLGLIDNRSLKINVSLVEFNRVVARFLLDTLQRIDIVNSRTSAKDRRDYADQLRKEGAAPITREVTPVDISAAHRIPALKNITANSSKQRNNSSPDNRSNVIPSSFKVSISEPVLKRLYDELRKLDAEHFSFAATYLFRAVIEQITTLFLKRKGLPSNGELHTKLERMAEALKADGIDDRQLKNLRTMANDTHSRYSPQTLGHFVHGGAVPTRTDAIKAWDSIEQVIAIVLTKLQ
jgi:hypothetical protein